MSQATVPQWHGMRDQDSLAVEEHLRGVFPHTDAYRYNSASIRIRIIDKRFAGMTLDARYDMIEPLLDQLPESLQSDIVNLLPAAPGELAESNRYSLRNREFDDPSLILI